MSLSELILNCTANAFGKNMHTYVHTNLNGLKDHKRNRGFLKGILKNTEISKELMAQKFK